jgi:hypothetical protein
VAVQTKGGRIRIVVCQVGGDGFDQLRQAAKDTPAQTFGGQVTKEALDYVELGGAGGREVQMKARVLREPRFDLEMLVRGVVIQNEMQVAIRRGLLI